VECPHNDVCTDSVQAYSTYYKNDIFCNSALGCAGFVVKNYLLLGDCFWQDWLHSYR